MNSNVKGTRWDAESRIESIPVGEHTTLIVSLCGRRAPVTGREWWYVRLQTHRVQDGGKSEPDGHLQYIPVERVPDLWEALQNAVQRVPKPWWDAYVDAPARAGRAGDSS